MRRSHLYFGLLIILLVFSCKKNNPGKDIATGLDFSDDYANYPIAPGGFSGTLPDVYIIPDMPSAGNQGQTNSCVGWATAHAVGSYYRHLKIGATTYDATVLCSPSYVYNQIYTGNCGGSQIYDALNLIKTQGVSSISDMAFTNDCDLLPNSTQQAAAVENKISSYGVVPKDIDAIKGHIVDNQPVIIGVNLDDGICECYFGVDTWSGSTGDCGAGGAAHAMTIYGFDNTRQAFKVLNSWGTSFGDQGSIWIPYSKMLQVAQELYVAFPQSTNNCAAIQLSAATDMNFGTVVPSPVPAPTRSLRIRNTGTCDLVVSDVVCPTGYSDNLSGQQTIASGGVTDITITFNPTTSGNFNGTINVISNATSGTGGAPVTGVCSGSTSGNGVLTPSSTSINFGTVTQNAFSSQNLTLSNSGGAALTVNSISNSNGTAFSIGALNYPITLNSSQTQSLLITFNTQNVGASTGSLTINSSVGNVVISLSGTVTSGGGTCASTFTDPRDGQVYPVVTIGGQCWMAANMKYDDPNSFLDRCYDNNSANCTQYGRLYEFASLPNIAPSGWHVPSFAEWETLFNNFMVATIVEDLNSAGWNVQAGGRYMPWGFEYKGEDQYIWTSTPYVSAACNFTAGGKRGMHIDVFYDDLYNEDFCPGNLFSIRLVKD